MKTIITSAILAVAMLAGSSAVSAKRVPDGFKRVPDSVSFKRVPDGFKRVPDGFKRVPDGIAFKRVPDGIAA